VVWQEARRVATGIANQAGYVYLDQGKVVEVEAPCPDSCRVLVHGYVERSRGLAENNDESDAVGQREDTGEAIQRRLDGRITVHVCTSSQGEYSTTLDRTQQHFEMLACPLAAPSTVSEMSQPQAHYVSEAGAASNPFWERSKGAPSFTVCASP
jgi:hypothetical protein